MKQTTKRGDVVETMSLQDLCRFCQADEAWVVELVEHGVLEPTGQTTSHWHFRATSIQRARKASRLTRDFGINTSGVAVVLDLIEQRDDLLRRLAHYEDIRDIL